MNISFEPGNGSFEVILMPEETLPKDWNIERTCVLQKDSKDPNLYHVIKRYGEVLEDA